jgi:hypothetical protein
LLIAYLNVEGKFMSKLFSVLAGLSMLGLVGTANAAQPVTLTEAQMDGVTAGQTTPENWGQEVKACNASSCYDGGTSRGVYVSGQATDPQTPGYAWEIHNLARPGNSNPAPF